jgi:hypothetical protein
MPQISIRHNINRKARTTYDKLAAENEEQLINTMRDLTVAHTPAAVPSTGVKRFTKSFDEYKPRKPKTFRI